MPTYEARLGAAAAVDDQRNTAAIMWVSGMLTTLPLLVAAVWRWASNQAARRPTSRGPRRRRRRPFRRRPRRPAATADPSRVFRPSECFVPVGPARTLRCIDRSDGETAGFQRPVKLGARRSRNEATPSLWSAERKQRSMTSRFSPDVVVEPSDRGRRRAAPWSRRVRERRTRRRTGRPPSRARGLQLLGLDDRHAT